MNTFKTISLSLGLAFLLTSSALGKTPVVYGSLVSLASRNMPTSCEFVFEVNSEIAFQIENSRVPVTAIQVSYLNEYTQEWSNPVQIPASPAVSANLPGTYQARAQLRSMSTNPKFLFRKVSFVLIPKQAHQAKAPYFAEFGREFGEKCFPNPSTTPFRQRPVSIFSPLL